MKNRQVIIKKENIMYIIDANIDYTDEKIINTCKRKLKL